MPHEQAVQAECLEHGAVEAVVVPVDLCSGSLSAAVEAADTATKGSGIDLLIHNAGVDQATVEPALGSHGINSY